MENLQSTSPALLCLCTAVSVHTPFQHCHVDRVADSSRNHHHHHHQESSNSPPLFYKPLKLTQQSLQSQLHGLWDPSNTWNIPRHQSAPEAFGSSRPAAAAGALALVAKQRHGFLRRRESGEAALEASEGGKEVQRCESQEKFNKTFSSSGGGALPGSVPKQPLAPLSST